MWWRKENWMAAAEVIDALRIFPRLLIMGYAWWVYVVTGLIVKNYFALQGADRTAEVTAFVAVALPGIFGLAAIVFNTYSNGGYDWEKYRAYLRSEGLPLQRPADHTDSSV